MGLDMYFSAKKYMSKYFDKADVERIEKINDIFGVTGIEDDDYGAQEVIFRVAYWRKANAIHKWFVDNVQNGTDDCGDYEVPNEKLKELLELVDQVLANKKKAHKLLPNTTGFFFGSQDYDEYYFQDLEYTKKLIEGILSNEELSKHWYLEYTSSW